MCLGAAVERGNERGGEKRRVKERESETWGAVQG